MRRCSHIALVVIAVLISLGLIAHGRTLNITNVVVNPSPREITLGYDDCADFNITIHYTAAGFDPADTMNFYAYLCTDAGTCGSMGDGIPLGSIVGPSGSGTVSRNCHLGGSSVFGNYNGGAKIRIELSVYDDVTPYPSTNTPYYVTGYTINNGCTFSLSSYEEDYPSSGGTGSLTINTQTGCSWNSYCDTDWVTITAGASGMGNGTVTYSIDDNAGGQRSTTIAVGNMYHRITQEAGYPPESSVLVLVKTDLCNELSSELARYVEDVTTKYLGTRLEIACTQGQTHFAIRSQIQEWYASHEKTAEGVILIGDLPTATWEFPWGEVCPLPLYYEDLDGEFSDQDGNGHLDYHAWGDEDAPQIWAAYVPGYGSSVGESIRRYLDKLHTYYEGTAPYTNLRPDTLLYVADEWVPSEGNCLPDLTTSMLDAKMSLTRICGGTSATDYAHQLENNLWAVADLWCHSSSEEHFLDEGSYSRASIASLDQANGAILTILWGSHAGDFLESENRSIAQAYVFGQSVGLASVSAVRSIGTEYQELFFGALKQGTIGDAYKTWLDYVYSQALIAQRFPDDNINRFVWDFIFYGDPFVSFDEI